MTAPGPPPQPPSRAPQLAVLAAVLAIAVLAAGVLLLTRGGAGDEVAEPAPSATASVPEPSTAPSPTPAEGPAQLSGQVSSTGSEGAAEQVLLTDLATGALLRAPVTDGTYRIELAPGSYAVGVLDPQDAFLATTSPGGGRCDDLVVVQAGEQNSVDVEYPCLAEGEPTSVAAAPPNPKVAEGLKAPTPQKIDRTDEFGEITSLKAQSDGSSKIEVDRVDWLSGAEAAVKDDKGAFPSDDYLAINDNAMLRSYTIAPDAHIWILEPAGNAELRRADTAALQNLFAAGPPALLPETYWHLQVTGDMVTGVEEQYRP